MIVLKYKRKNSITQMQITDYIFGVKEYVYVMSIQKDYRTAMKLIYSVPRKPKQKRGRKKDITKLFYRIDHFIKKGDLSPIKPQYLRRFRDVAVVPESEINYEGISAESTFWLYWFFRTHHNLQQFFLFTFPLFNAVKNGGYTLI